MIASVLACATLLAAVPDVAQAEARANSTCCDWFSDIEYRRVGTYREIDVDFADRAATGKFEDGAAPYAAFELPVWREPIVVAIDVDMQRHDGFAADNAVFAPRVFFLDADKQVVKVRDDLGIRRAEAGFAWGFDSGVLLGADARHVRYVVVTPDLSRRGEVVNWYNGTNAMMQGMAYGMAGAAAGLTPVLAGQVGGSMASGARSIFPVEIASTGRFAITTRTQRRLRGMSIRDYLDQSPSLFDPEFKTYAGARPLSKRRR